jgi:hypothetical protein
MCAQTTVVAATLCACSGAALRNEAANVQLVLCEKLAAPSHHIVLLRDVCVY